jgi:hypothetical protein
LVRLAMWGYGPLMMARREAQEVAGAVLHLAFPMNPQVAINSNPMEETEHLEGVAVKVAEVQMEDEAAKVEQALTARAIKEAQELADPVGQEVRRALEDLVLTAVRVAAGATQTIST